ncbi:MAG: hypothetical protein ACOCY0_04610 [Roseicyclus sp.]
MLRGQKAHLTRRINRAERLLEAQIEDLTSGRVDPEEAGHRMAVTRAYLATLYDIRTYRADGGTP